jgi:hypothetical protein
MTAVALIPEIPGGTIAVQIAWGADLTDIDGSGWSWIDITGDVRLDQGLSGELGRNDEASTANPAKLTLTLDNSAGTYSLGAASPHYPYVRRNTPVRVRVDTGGGAVTLWQGYTVGFTPSWDDDTGMIPVVTLEAAGALRRLQQGSDPLKSALYRYHTLTTSPADYWPLEEESTATEAVSGAGGLVGTFDWVELLGVRYGKIAWGADTDNPATARAVQVSAGGTLILPVRTTLFSHYWAATWAMRYTSGSGGFFDAHTNDPSVSIHGVLDTDGTVEVYLVSDPFTSTLMITWSQGSDFYLWDDVWHSYALTVDETGASLVVKMYLDGVQKGSTYSTTKTGTAPTDVTFSGAPNPGGTEDPITVGQVAVWSSAPTLADVTDAHAAHRGETADERLVRLCDEESINLTVVGTSISTMGPQRVDGLVALLRECETVDLGVLYDGVTPGLTYVCRDQRENADVALTLGADELVAPIEPADDDQRDINRVTATSGSGAKVTFEDTDGPKGTEVIGVYDTSITVNVDDDDDLDDYASWAVHEGTVVGYRFPSVTVDLRAAPSRADDVLACAPSTRIAVTDPADVLAALPPEDLDLLVEGVAWKLSPFSWQSTLRCSPAGIWTIATLASDTGDTDLDVWRLDTDGSSLASSASAGATTLSVATPSGPLWTTTADDYPLYLDIGGLRVRATACTGSSSPQTMTVDALSTARSSGVSVSVWDPPVLGV